MCVRVCVAHSIQSTTSRRAMSDVGSPTLLSTITMVNSPAEGTAAAPTAARMAVILRKCVWGGGGEKGGE